MDNDNQYHFCRLCLNFIQKSKNKDKDMNYSYEAHLNQLKSILPEIAKNLNVLNHTKLCPYCVEQLSQVCDIQEKMMTNQLSLKSQPQNKSDEMGLSKISSNMKKKKINICSICLKDSSMKLSCVTKKSKNYNIIQSMIRLCTEDEDSALTGKFEICQLCLSTLQTSHQFLTTCSANENNITNYCEDNNIEKLAMEDIFQVSKSIHEENSNFVKNTDNVEIETNKSSEKKDLFKCPECIFKTKKRNELTIHLISEHLQSADFNCNHCDYKSKSNTNLKVHISKCRFVTSKTVSSVKDSSNTGLLQCPQCFYTTTNKYYLNRHINVRHGNKKFKCDICQFKTKVKYSLKEHMKTHLSPNSTNTYSCEECPFKTMYKHSLAKHTKQHELTGSKGILQCHYCSFKCLSRVSLTRHIVWMHDPPVDDLLKVYSHKPTEIKYKCSLCPYLINSKSLFEQHQKMHELPIHKQFICYHCSCIKLSKLSMKNHLPIHQTPGNDKFKCTECEYSTNFRSNYERHIKCVHSDTSKGFECPECDYVSVIKRNMSKHINTQHVNKKIKCEYCAYITVDKNSFEEHKKYHTESKEHVYCYHCSKKFIWKTSLIKHFKICKNKP